MLRPHLLYQQHSIRYTCCNILLLCTQSKEYPLCQLLLLRNSTTSTSHLLQVRVVRPTLPTSSTFPSKVVQEITTNMLATISLLITLLSMLSTVAYACSCFPLNFQQQYCATRTTVRARVIAKYDNCPGVCDPLRDQGNGVITYIAQIVYLYKGLSPEPGTEIEHGIMRLSTAVNGALCGVRLTVGETYLLNLHGKKDDAMKCPRASWYVGLCSFPRIWRYVSQADLALLGRVAKGEDVCVPRDVPRAPVVDINTTELDLTPTPFPTSEVEIVKPAQIIL